MEMIANETHSMDSDLLRQVTNGDEDVHTPRIRPITPSSTFVCVERLLKVDHGVDYDSKEKNPIITVTANPLDPSIVATGGLEGTVRIWSIRRHELKSSKMEDIGAAHITQVTTLLGHSGQVNGLRFSPNGAMLASGSADGTVRVYSTQTGGWKLLHSLRFHTLDVTDVAWFSPTVIVSTGTDRNTVIWDANTGGRSQTLYSDKGSCPKGLAVDPKGEYLTVLFDEGLIDIYRRNIDGKFRLSRHVNLTKDDAPNYARAFKTTLYARRIAWTSDGKHMLFPLGSRGKHGPCGVQYDRFNLLDPTPGETLLPTKVFAGHPSRVVVVTVRPGKMVNEKISEDPFTLSALVSVDGVVSLWASTREQPVAVIANITGPLRVCTDATWAGDSLILSASDGSVTSVTFKNLGRVDNSDERAITVPAQAPAKVGDDVKSAQVELRVGGKRKIQPVVADAMGSTKQPESISSVAKTVLPAQVRDKKYLAENKESKFHLSKEGTEVYSGSGSISCLACTSNLIVLGVVDEMSLGSLLVLRPDVKEERILLPGIPRLLTAFPEYGYLSFLLDDKSLCVWKSADNGTLEAVWDDVPVVGLMGPDDGVQAISVMQDGVPTLTLKSGKGLTFNPRLRRWVMS